MIVHGGRPSPFARKVLVTLEEKGIPYEQKDLSPANLGIDASRWPKLASYFETTLARPSFKTAMG